MTKQRIMATGFVAELVRQARAEHPTSDFAGKGFLTTQVVCRAPECGRPFFGLHALTEHAEAVHTFSDTERLVSEAVREKFGRRGDYKATPPIPSIWCWINDIATDWVVFTVEGGDTQIKETLYKAPYSVDASNVVTIGDPVHVVRRTVYEPVTPEPEKPEVITP